MRTTRSLHQGDLLLHLVGSVVSVLRKVLILLKSLCNKLLYKAFLVMHSLSFVAPYFLSYVRYFLTSRSKCYLCFRQQKILLSTKLVLFTKMLILYNFHHFCGKICSNMSGCVLCRQMIMWTCIGGLREQNWWRGKEMSKWQDHPLNTPSVHTVETGRQARLTAAFCSYTWWLSWCGGLYYLQ